MTQDYFTLNDNFEEIIRSKLCGVENVVKIPTGWTNYVFKVSSVYGDYIFRFPRNSFFANVLAKEVAFNKYIRGKLDVKTANLKYMLHDGRGYSMHKMIPGIVLTEAYGSMTAEQKRLLAEDIADYLESLQNVKPRNIKTFNLEPIAMFLSGLAKVNNDNYNYRILAPFSTMQDNMVLCHGDFNPGNIVLDRSYRLVAVLDYAFVSYSCKENDLSRLIMRLPEDFSKLIFRSFENKLKSIDFRVVDELIPIWKYVERDYISYIAKHHPDIVLPTL